MARSGESGPGSAKATERPMRKESCKGKDKFERGGQNREYGPGGTKGTERPMRKESCKEKGQV